MTVSETPTQEQIAASERAMDGLEAQADIWAEEVRLIDQVKLIGHVARGLNDRMPADVRNGFIARMEAQVDAFLRQAYLEGFYRGGESRKDYDALTAALSDQAGAPVEVRLQNDAIDEIVIKRADTVHIEQMSADGWFMGVSAADGSYWQFWFGSKNRKSHVEFRHTETTPPSSTAGEGK